MTEPTTDPTPEALLQELWYDLVEKDDRTSPEEYPDMAMLTRDEFFAYLRVFAQDAVEREHAKNDMVVKQLHRELERANNMQVEAYKGQLRAEIALVDLLQEQGP